MRKELDSILTDDKWPISQVWWLKLGNLGLHLVACRKHLLPRLVSEGLDTWEAADPRCQDFVQDQSPPASYSLSSWTLVFWEDPCWWQTTCFLLARQLSK